MLKLNTKKKKQYSTVQYWRLRRGLKPGEEFRGVKKQVLPSINPTTFSSGALEAYTNTQGV